MIENKLDNKKNNNNKKPLKLSSRGRLQIRKNLGPSSSVSKNKGNQNKTIQIVFRNKNNQQKSTSTAQSSHRGSSSFRSSAKSNLVPSSGFFPKKNKFYNQKNKKFNNLKKNQTKKTTLKPNLDDSGKLNLNKILEQEEQEFDKFPSLAKLKRAREKEKLKSVTTDDDTKIGKEIVIPEIITVQELANRMAEKTADVVKTLMKMDVMANAAQSLEADTAALVATELGHRVKLVSDDDVLYEIFVNVFNVFVLPSQGKS